MMTVALTLALIILNALTVLGAFLLLHRQGKTGQETLQTVLSAHRLEMVGVLDRAETERQKHREEVQTLCQRLQAPQVAVMEHQIANAGPPEAVLPLTDEESARQQAESIVERIREMEQAENEQQWARGQA